eukprot:CAMPEP_0178416204 /NCGR_PEP_ID=MMETSP0689_2-20121128/23944_1 /TAXON_ID=160604 /ORGANISM="Amphidinium massartii, Strain CS-259" /LENGTH=106 /DNA_ID=CAMNT_0020037543 /DNA_START=66 /DNA_END=383 /DNA_ORIENTATION=+
MALSKPAMMAASLVAAASVSPSVAFQAPGTSVQQVQTPNTGAQVSSSSADLQQAAVATEAVSGRVAASGIATLAAAAVLMANTRRYSKSSAVTKVAVKAFESERGV